MAVRDQTQTADDAALLGVIVGQSPVGVAVFDTDARYVRVNPALQRMVGLDAADMLGRTVREVLVTGNPVVGADLDGRLPGSPAERERALALQRSPLPERLPVVPGVVAAARYLPAHSDGETVGGDWYEVVRLPGGRVAIVVGDVMGRGLAAATLMGQVRAALRAYAVQDQAPGVVLTHADELVRGLADDVLVRASTPCSTRATAPSRSPTPVTSRRWFSAASHRTARCAGVSSAQRVHRWARAAASPTVSVT